MCVAPEPGARVGKPSSVRVPVGRLWSLREAVQSTVHVGRTHAPTHRRETSPMHGQSVTSWSVDGQLVTPGTYTSLI